MTVIVPSPAVRPPGQVPDPARTLDMLATVVILVLAVGILYLAREILVPIAIAILLSFVLSPPVKLLRSIGLGKALSVSLVVVLTVLVASGLGIVFTKQIADLAADAPRYQATVTEKVEFAQRLLASNPFLTKLNTVAADISKASPPEAKAPDAKAPDAKAPYDKTPDAKPARSRGTERTANGSPPQLAVKPSDPTKPVLVEVMSPAPGALTILQTVGAATASPIATAAFIALFVIFILMQREDLRNRFIRLVGFGDLNRTTLAMNEAARRLSRYFLAQVLLNTAFGIVAAVTLAVIGVPGAILWGIVATFMRFIPYLGTVGAVFFPLLLAAASSTGWTMVAEVAVLFVAIELVTGQIIEPLVYGRNTGLSPIAVVVSATFWTWLWGPVGLVLSTPLTVCLLVMGRHVERFSFLYVLLGDTPALTAVESFYQRMLVDDPSEIVDHAEDFVREKTLLTYCDEVAMKALLLAQIDVRRGALDENRQIRIRDLMRDLVDDLADLVPADMAATAPAPASLEAGDGAIEPGDAIPKLPIAEGWKRQAAVLCVAGRTALDEAAAHILADLLGQYGIGTKVEPAESLVSNTLGHPGAVVPELVILSFLDADLSVAQARFAVRRLRRQIPNAPIVAAFWMPEADEARTLGLCDEVRCDTCVANLPQALKLCLDRAAEPAAARAA